MFNQIHGRDDRRDIEVDPPFTFKQSSAENSEDIAINKVQNPDPSGSGEFELRQQVVVWSKGKPREKGTENDARDWHTSW